MTKIAKKDFPAAVWDGLCYQYDSILIDKDPSFFWQDKATQEIQAVEQYLIDRGSLFSFFDILGPANSFIAVSADSSELVYKEFSAGPGIEIVHTDDTITISATGTTTLLNDDTTIPKGTPVYSFANGSFKRARANSVTSIKVIGLAFETINASTSGKIQTDGILTATTSEWDIITGSSGGLIQNSLYYLNEMLAGGLKNTAPTSGYIVPVGTAISSTQLKINLFNSVLL